MLEQLELQLADLEEDAAAGRSGGADGERREAKIAVQALRAAQAGAPAVARAPAARAHRLSGTLGCPCCGGTLHKIGEDVTETLELIPRQWKVIQHVREKFSCRSLRGDHPAAGAVASDCARARRARAARACPVRQVLPASAAQSPERDLCARRHRARRLDACRLGRRLCGNPDAAGRM